MSAHGGDSLAGRHCIHTESQLKDTKRHQSNICSAKSSDTKWECRTGSWDPVVTHLHPSAQSLLCSQLGVVKACPPAFMLPCRCLVWGVSALHPPPVWDLHKGRNQSHVFCHFLPTLLWLSPRSVSTTGQQVGFTVSVVCSVSARDSREGPSTCLRPYLVSSEF